MKLHHFITTKVSEEGTRVRELGKALALTSTITPVTEVKLADIKKIGEKIKVEKGDDLTQQIRDFAVDQMEHSEHCAHLHRKIRHYD